MEIRFVDPSQLTGVDAAIFELMTDATTSRPRLTGEQAEDGFARFIGEAIACHMDAQPHAKVAPP